MSVSSYLFAMCANGLQVTVGDFTVRPRVRRNSVVPPRAIRLRGPRARTRSPIAVGMIIGSVGLVAVQVTSGMLFGPETAASLRMAVRLIAVVPLTQVALDPRFVVQSGTAILSAISTVSIVNFALDPSIRANGLALEPNVMARLCAGWIGSCTTLQTNDRWCPGRRCC